MTPLSLYADPILYEKIYNCRELIINGEENIYCQIWVEAPITLILGPSKLERHITSRWWSPMHLQFADCFFFIMHQCTEWISPLLDPLRWEGLWAYQKRREQVREMESMKREGLEIIMHKHIYNNHCILDDISLFISQILMLSLSIFWVF